MKLRGVPCKSSNDSLVIQALYLLSVSFMTVLDRVKDRIRALTKLESPA